MVASFTSYVWIQLCLDVDPVFSKKIKVDFLVLLVLVLFYCSVSLLTALICLLNRNKWLSGHKLIQFFELFFRTWPAMFSIRCLHRGFLRPDFLEMTFPMTSVTSTALQLKFVYVTSLVLLGQLRDLPHAKKWLLNSLMEIQILWTFTN